MPNLARAVFKMRFPFFDFIFGNKGLSMAIFRRIEGQQLRTGQRPAGAIIDPRQKQGRINIDILRSLLRLRNFNTSLVSPKIHRCPIGTGWRIGDRFNKSSSLFARTAGYASDCMRNAKIKPM